MADSGSGESGDKEGKRGFSSRLTDKITLKNPFKRGNSSCSGSDDEDIDRQKPSAASRRGKIKSGLSNISTTIKSHLPTKGSSSSGVSPKPSGASPESHDAVEKTQRSASSSSSSSDERTTQPVGESAAGSRTSAESMCSAGSGGSTSTGRQDAPKADNAPASDTSNTCKTPKEQRKVDGGPVYGTPEIVVTGVKGDPDEAMNAFRTRGFVVHLSMLHEDTTPATMTIVLAMGPKLLAKSALERNLPTKDRGEYTSEEVSQLCADATQVIKRSEVDYEEVNLLHDKSALDMVTKADFHNTPNAVHSYFGPYFGMYFAWLRFYTWALVVPGVAGLFLFIDQWRTNSPDSPWLPVFCVVIMIWCALFLDLWKRRNSSIAFSWGVDGVEEEELMRAVEARDGELASNPAGKLCVTVPIILAAIYVVIRIMLYCEWLRDNAVEVYDADSYMRYYPNFLYSVTPLVGKTLYGFLAKALNDYEEHLTAAKKKNMLVLKMFAFQFINSYSGLLYVAFWKRDLNRLRTLLMTMMIVKQSLRKLIETYKPVVARWMKDRKEKKEPRKEPTFLVKHTGTITAEDLFDEMKAEPADVEDDFLEMVLQFGYVSMFAVVFPLAPLFAILNNVWEFKLDLGRLVKSRRPHSHAESTIGAWQLCLEIVAIVACLTNLVLAVFVCEHVSLYTPDGLSNHLGSMEAKFLFVVVVEHLLFVGKAVASGVVDRVPRVVREAQANLAIQRKKKRKELGRRSSGLPESKDSNTSPAKPLFASPKDDLRQLHETHGVWKFGPMWYLPLALIPFLIAWFEMSIFLVLPVAFMWMSYLQNQKDRSDKALALGVVKDPKVLELVTGFLPEWYTDSEVERVRWLNKILTKMWSSASGATEDLFKTTVQPILDSNRPPQINALGFRKVSLGTIPPKIVGIRSLETKGDKVVVDIDIRWAANAEFVVEAGVNPVPLLVTLNKICFSGRLRVELAPLVPKFPCFGAIALTFIEKPFIDFNFSLGKLEVMSIGPGDLSVGKMVCDTIKNIIHGMMVFPTKMVTPILDEQDLLALANPTPCGVVELTVVGANNLKGSDFLGKSDPYVKVKLGTHQEVKTEPKKRTRNPRFEKTFDLMVYEPSVEVLEFEVHDMDTANDDDLLGSCELPLSLLTPDVESAHNLPLSGASTGSLLIKTIFIPLSSGAERLEEDDEDVIIEVTGGDITDDIVAADKYDSSSSTAKDAASGPEADSSKKHGVDPSALKPQPVLTDTSMGVISVMGIECKNVKPGDRYVSVMCGNTSRRTAVVKNMAAFVCPEVFHFLVRGTKTAVVEILLREKKSFSDKTWGSLKVKVAEVIANDDLLDGEWDFDGEKTEGSIKMRLKWAGRAGSGAH